MGRKTGGHNGGPWWYDGRGWFVTEGSKRVKLVDEHGEHIKAEDAPKKLREAAYARYVLSRQERARQQATGENMLIGEVARLYLPYCAQQNKPATFRTRAHFLFWFCTGLPPKFRDKGDGKKPPKPKPDDRVHRGFGDKTVGELTPHDIDGFLAAHADWGNDTRRIAIQSIKAAFNWAVTRKLIPSNPIKGYKTPKGRRRVTYFTPVIEQQLYRYSNKAFALALRVCILTGARPDEFCRLTARHVHETGKGQLWRYSAEEHKTGKQTGEERLIRVPDEVADIVRGLIQDHPTERLFRNRFGRPWNQSALKTAFDRLRKRLAKKGIELGPDDTMYTCRHTYAQRALAGTSTGKPCSIAQLAKAMGNSPDICMRHYGQWAEEFDDPVWEVVKGPSVPK